MSFVAGLLNQDITYWPITGLSGFGGDYIYGSPIFIKGRWEDRSELFVNQKGEEEKSMARVYVDSDIEVGTYLYLGKNSALNPEPIEMAFVVKGFKKIPNILGTEFLRTAYL